MTVFTRTWNGSYEASPANTQAASQGAQRIRELKLDLRERLAVDHIFGDGSANEGYHNVIHLPEQGSDPGGVANYGVVYTKDVSTITELFYRDSAGTVTQITRNGSVLSRFVGEIVAHASTSTPVGFLPCDGAAVSRTTYSALFAVIGTIWGAGDGSTTFNVPNLARRTMVGKGGTGSGTLGNAVGNTGGAETVNLAHTHSVNFASGGLASGVEAQALGQSPGINTVSASHTHSVVGSTASGSSATQTIMQPSAVVGFFIKY